MAIQFKVIKPKDINVSAFNAAFMNAAKKMAIDVHKDLDTVTEKWKTVVIFDELIQDNGKGIDLSVMTGNRVFKYYDQGNGGRDFIIRPTRAKALHWVTDAGEDIFRKWVHGYEGRKAVEKVEKVWIKKAPKYFEDVMGMAVLKSGHAIK